MGTGAWEAQRIQENAIETFQKIYQPVSLAVEKSKFFGDPDLDVAVVDHKDVSKVIESFWVEYAERTEEEINFSIVDKNYRKFQESSNREVNYLVKEFECRKSAASYARQTTSRTGVIDCTKLHTYKYSEDIFKKVTSIPDGKNHGL